MILYPTEMSTSLALLNDPQDNYPGEPFTLSLKLTPPALCRGIRAELYIIEANGESRNVELLPFRQAGHHHYFRQTVCLQQIGWSKYYARAVIESAEVTTAWQFIRVKPPAGETWQSRAVARQVASGLWVGNARAAFEADHWGFDAILSLTERVDFATDRQRATKHLPLQDWGSNRIPAEKIVEGVAWLDQQINQGRRVIVNCRAGIGRSGSMAVAYLYKHNPALNYHQVVERARQGDPTQGIEGKADIYPHVGLQASLERLYPAPQRPAEPSLAVMAMQLRDLAVRATVRLRAGDTLELAVHLEHHNQHAPVVVIRTNIDHHGAYAGDWQEIVMQARDDNPCDYRAAVSAHYPGHYWLTVRAQQYRFLPWYEEQDPRLAHWLGGDVLVEVLAR